MEIIMTMAAWSFITSIAAVALGGWLVLFIAWIDNLHDHGRFEILRWPRHHNRDRLRRANTLLKHKPRGGRMEYIPLIDVAPGILIWIAPLLVLGFLIFLVLFAWLHDACTASGQIGIITKSDLCRALSTAH